MGGWVRQRLRPVVQSIILYALRQRLPTLPQADAWGSIAAPGRAHEQICADGARIGHGRSGAYGRLGINALTWGIRTALFAQCDAKPEAHGEKKTAKPTINQLSCQAAAPSGVRLPHCLPTRSHVKASLSSSARAARTFGAPPRSGGGATQNRRRMAIIKMASKVVITTWLNG